MSLRYLAFREEFIIKTKPLDVFKAPVVQKRKFDIKN